MKIIESMKRSVCRSIRVPDDLLAVSTINDFEETDPEEVGMTAGGVAEIWAKICALYQTGIHPGITFCLRRRGRIVMNRAIGHSRGNGPKDPIDAPKVLITPDTPVCQYSASKAVTAMMIHLLAERGEVRLLDPVARYIPEFAAHGKLETSIYQLISHQGGIPAPPPDADPEILFDPDAFVKLICDLKPKAAGGMQIAYHAVTGGAILGEVVRRVTGMNLREFLRLNVQEPLGFNYFNYGLNAADLEKAAHNYDTGPPQVFPLSAITRRALSLSWGEVVDIADDPRFKQAIIPAANLYATAEEMSRFFQLLLNEGELDGVRIFAPGTVRCAVQPARRMGIDRTMIVPMRYSAGFMLGAWPVGLWGPSSEEAFGHVGFINILCWADPKRDIAVSLQTTGKSLFSPHLVALVRLVWAIAGNCPADAAPEKQGVRRDDAARPGGCGK